MDETTAVRRLSSSSSSLSTYIPLEIIQETILCRLPVNSLIRFRCVCKSCDSLISKDLKFAKKHLLMSPKRQHLVTTTWMRTTNELTVMSCPFDSLNLYSTFDSKSTQLENFPVISINYGNPVSSCDGILCFVIDKRLTVLYNPCIRKLQKLPYIDLPQGNGSIQYAFGYDPFIDNYKVVAILWYDYEHALDMGTSKSQVHSYILGTDSWQRIKDFPSMYYSCQHGIFMRGTVNWFGFSVSDLLLDVIVSLHLEKESYQEISLPDVENSKTLTLDVMRDCLCVLEISQENDTNVWLMKEYGNKESWIKSICLPCFGCTFSYDFLTDIVYISEDNNHVLLVYEENSKFKWVVYDVKNDNITRKSSKIQDKLGVVKLKVYVESLISP